MFESSNWVDLFAWIVAHPFITLGGITTFVFGIARQLYDGDGIVYSLGKALLAVFIYISILPILRIMEVTPEYTPIIGVILGSVGSDGAVMILTKHYKKRLGVN